MKKFGKGKPKHRPADDEGDNPNMIPVKSRGGFVESVSSRRNETADSDNEFDLMAPVDKSEVVTMDLSDPEDADEDAAFNINKDFAIKYEERKKAEEISFLKDRYGENYDEGDDDEDDSESDEEEDENGELLTKELDLQILKTIGLIRSKAPEVYNPEKVFFTGDDLKKSEESWKEKQEEKKAQGKKMTLKDYHRQRLLEGGGLEEDDEDENDTYLEEQEDIKKRDDDEEDDLLASVDDQRKVEAYSQCEEADYKSFLVQNIKKDGVLNEWAEFGEGKEEAIADPNEKFLMDFILNKKWVDEEGDETKIPTGEDEADRFEHAYNFRFEEAEGTNIQTFSRTIEDSMRRKDSTRAEKRAAVKARKAEEKKAKEEELKRLKNLKKEELRLKLQKIADVAGTDMSVFDGVDLEEEFDPNKFDEMMAKRFNDEYYDDQEAIGGDLQKPVFDDGLDMDELDYYDDDDIPPPPPVAGLVDEHDFEIDGLIDRELGPKAGEGKVLKKVKPQEEEEKLKKKEAKENKLKRKLADQEDDGYGYNEEEEDIIMDADYLPGGEYYGEEEQPTGKKKDKKKELKEKKKAAKEKDAAATTLDDYIDEYLQMDYEDMIGDLPTRFKYRKVEPENFGISAVDILTAPETALNEFVPLKHIAPFRPEQRKQRDREIWSKTKKKRMKKLKDAIEAEKAGKTLEEWENAKREKKRKLRRKRRKPCLKEGVSSERLASYGIPSRKK
ncbi:Krr1-domain-containing protein [Rhizoclosmatium globosum]|uniref:Krr1-domain-containing protein n=1 Tax=Rhizoclosmatium globosum TaxID=329046 RepID=A0A1Y2D0Z0_9FUNG|nr:Krr1-domain-containing protein [Rhizoclosmatium globosum]|eukprot:ORY52948.1 Krr1-domain-containing protein [Rhizoclosmatium globosum]